MRAGMRRPHDRSRERPHRHERRARQSADRAAAPSASGKPPGPITGPRRTSVTMEPPSRSCSTASSQPSRVCENPGFRLLHGRGLGERRPFGETVDRGARGNNHVRLLLTKRLGKALGADAPRRNDLRAPLARQGPMQRLAHQMHDTLHAVERRAWERLRARMPFEGNDAVVEELERAMRATRDNARPQALVEKGLGESPADQAGGTGNKYSSLPLAGPSRRVHQTPAAAAIPTGHCGRSMAAT